MKGGIHLIKLLRLSDVLKHIRILELTDTGRLERPKPLKERRTKNHYFVLKTGSRRKRMNEWEISNDEARTGCEFDKCLVTSRFYMTPHLLSAKTFY